MQYRFFCVSIVFAAAAIAEGPSLPPDALAAGPDERPARVAALLDFAAAPGGLARREALRVAGWMAGAEDVPRFAAFLDDPVCWPEALNALMALPQGVEAVMARIPGETSADKQIEMVRALGQAQIREARPLLEGLARASENRPLAWAALEALARIGVPATAVIPRQAEFSREELARYAAAGLRAAQELLDHGQRDEAERLFRAFVDASGYWSQIQAAMTGLNAAGSMEAVRTALGFLNTPRLRAAAKRILATSTAEGAAEMIDKAYAVGDPAMQAALLEIFAERGTPAEQKKLEDALNSPAAEVRFTAARLLRRPPNDADLVEIATKGGPWIRAAALDTFLESANARLLAGDHPAAAAQFRAILNVRLGPAAERAALEGLGQCGELSDQVLAAEFMGDPETGPAAYAATARLAARNPDRDAAVKQLETIAEVSPHEEGVFAAANALAQLGLPDAKYNLQHGFLSDWLAMGPFPNENGTAYGLSYITEARADQIQSARWLGTQFQWEKAPARGFPATVDLRQLYTGASASAAYLFAKFAVPEAAACELQLGVGGAFELWLNGEKIAGEENLRPFRLDEVHVPATLKAGTNKVLIKLIQSPGDWRCALRLTDRRGRPMDLTRLAPPPDPATGIGVAPGTANSTLQDPAP